VCVRILEEAPLIKFLSRLIPEKKTPPKNLGRNERCWCGSGKKYKYCCYEKDQKYFAAERAKQCGFN
jgi:hypothetical protein